MGVGSSDWVLVLVDEDGSVVAESWIGLVETGGVPEWATVSVGAEGTVGLE